MTRPTPILLASLLLLGLAAEVRAEVVSREAVTLGALTDRLDLVVLTRVERVEPTSIALVCEEVLKGRPRSTLRLPRGNLRWAAGERALLFVDVDLAGRPRRLSGSWARLPVTPASEPALLAAVKSRLPRVGGDPLAPRAALFSQLATPVRRVRDDAALELLQIRNLQATAAERAHLIHAVRAHGTELVLRLAARLPGPDLRAPVLDAALAATGNALDGGRLDAAAVALRATHADPHLALRTPLQISHAPRAINAARLLGELGTPESLTLLAGALDDPRQQVRRAAYRGLADGGAAVPASVVADLEQRALAGPDVRFALAALARIGAGPALRRLAARHTDPALLALIDRLRREPIETPRRTLD